MESDVSYTPIDDESVVFTEPFPPSSPIRRLNPRNNVKLPVHHPDFVLDDSNSPIYLVSNGLIRRTLLPPLEDGTDRLIKVECTQ